MLRRSLAVSVEQAGVVLGVGRSTAYELVRSGDLASLRLRRRVVVPVSSLAAQLGVTVEDIWRCLEGQPLEQS